MNLKTRKTQRCVKFGRRMKYKKQAHISKPSRNAKMKIWAKGEFLTPKKSEDLELILNLN